MSKMFDIIEKVAIQYEIVYNEEEIDDIVAFFVAANGL